MVKLGEYCDRLNRHDWYYQYTEDQRVWRRGQMEQVKLESIATLSDKHRALWQSFNACVFSGPHWGTERKRKPEKPDE